MSERKGSWIMPTLFGVIGTGVVGLFGVGISKVERLIDRVETVTIQNAEIRKDIEYMQKAIEDIRKHQ